MLIRMRENTLLLRDQEYQNILYQFIVPWIYLLADRDDDSELISYFRTCINSELTHKGQLLWSEYDTLSELLHIVNQRLYERNCTEEYEFFDDLKNHLDIRLTAISSEFDIADDEDFPKT